MAPVDRAEQVQLDQARLGFNRYLLEWAPHARAGVVEPHVDPAEGRSRGTCQLAHLVGVGDVGRQGERPSAKRLAVSYGLLEQFEAAGGKDHVGTASGKSLSGCESYTARGTGDHHRGVAQAFDNNPPSSALFSVDALPTPSDDIIPAGRTSKPLSRISVVSSRRL